MWYRCSAHSWLDSSVGRVLHRYRRGHRFEYCFSLYQKSYYKVANVRYTGMNIAINYWVIVNIDRFKQYHFRVSLVSRRNSCKLPLVILLVYQPVFSRERFTTVTAYRGFVTKSQLLETLFTRNLLTKVGRIQRAIWGFLGKQVLRCCTGTIGKL